MQPDPATVRRKYPRAIWNAAKEICRAYDEATYLGRVLGTLRQAFRAVPLDIRRYWGVPHRHHSDRRLFLLEPAHQREQARRKSTAYYDAHRAEIIAKERLRHPPRVRWQPPETPVCSRGLGRKCKAESHQYPCLTFIRDFAEVHDVTVGYAKKLLKGYELLDRLEEGR